MSFRIITFVIISFMSFRIITFVIMSFCLFVSLHSSLYHSVSFRIISFVIYHSVSFVSIHSSLYHSVSFRIITFGIISFCVFPYQYIRHYIILCFSGILFPKPHDFWLCLCLSLSLSQPLSLSISVSVCFCLCLSLPVFVNVIITIIIIAFKGAIRDFLQSPHSAANSLQHVRSNGPGAIVCKSRATHLALFTCKCHVTCHLVRRDSSAIKFDKS